MCADVTVRGDKYPDVDLLLVMTTSPAGAYVNIRTSLLIFLLTQ